MKRTKKLINIMANVENDNILDEIKKQDAKGVCLYLNREYFTCIMTKDVDKIEFNETTQCIIVETTIGIIWCTAVHFMNLKTNTYFCYSNNEDEFYECEV